MNAIDLDRLEERFATLNELAPWGLMKFTLTYEGPLCSAGTSRNGRARTASDKWAIRNQLHPQLKRLWAENEILQRVHATSVVNPASGFMFFDRVDGKFSTERRRPTAVEIDLCAPIAVGNTTTSFVPLIRSSLSLMCGVNILFLRQEDPGNILADLDNRIKVLFDGLRGPSLDDLQSGKPDEEPHYCLLEDDRLVASMSVDGRKLLAGAPPGDPRPDDYVRLIMEVSVIVTRVHGLNSPLLGG